MLGFITNIGLPELTVIAALAVVIFGRRLPQVAAEAYRQIVRLRQAIEKVRRDSGIDRELRDIEYEVRDAARKASMADVLQPPEGLRAARGPNPEASIGDPGGSFDREPGEPAAQEATDEPEDTEDSEGAETSTEERDGDWGDRREPTG